MLLLQLVPLRGPLLARLLVRTANQLLSFAGSGPKGPKIAPRSVRSRLYSTNSSPPKNSPPRPPFNVFTGLLIFAAGAVFGATLLWFEPKPSTSSSTTKLNQLDLPKYATNAQIDTAIVKIKQIVTPLNVENTADLVTNDKEQLASHSDTYFNSHHALPETRPRYVVYPQLTEQVSQVMAICHEHRIPVVPITGGSSLEGHFIPTRGGISLDLSGLNQIIDLHQEDLDMTVQAGVGWEELADYLEPYNLMFGPDPGPGADIGGMCATNCSGTNASRYGECFKNILSLTVVLADGTIVKTKQRPRKTSAGYNLNSLFIGSEGTLGIITEATLKLHVKPNVEAVAVVPFPSIKDAANAVNNILLKGIELNAIELLDDKMMSCINQSGETSRSWTGAPTLFLKIGGSSQVIVDTLVNEVKELTVANKSKDFIFASSDDEKEELWAARKVALWSTINQGKQSDPNIQLWTTDAAVPISRLPQFLVDTKKDIDNHGLSNTLVAHIGDGNAHSFILYKPSERETAEMVVGNMIKRALANDGTCTGEHGVGYGKRDFLVEEVGEAPIDVMRLIKMSVDPRRILNPDKIFRIDPHEPPEKH